MLSNSSNPRASVAQTTAVASSERQAPSTAGIRHRESMARSQSAPSGTGALPYRPAQQLELLNLHAELDALQSHLNVTREKQSRELVHQ